MRGRGRSVPLHSSKVASVVRPSASPAHPPLTSSPFSRLVRVFPKDWTPLVLGRGYPQRVYFVVTPSL